MTDKKTAPRKLYSKAEIHENYRLLQDAVDSTAKKHDLDCVAVTSALLIIIGESLQAYREDANLTDDQFLFIVESLKTMHTNALDLLPHAWKGT
jgi:hypothetical protein